VPTIPLYNTSAAPDGWHQVRSPGGFEAWCFHGIDQSAGNEIFAALFDGNPFDPDYARLYRRYIRRPTRFAPPLPCHFQCTCMAIDDDLTIRRFPAGSLRGSSEMLDVRLGFHHITGQPSRAIQMKIGSAGEDACEILFDAVSSMASVRVNQPAEEPRKYICMARFEHAFGTAPPTDGQLPVASIMRRFGNPRVIASSAASPPPAQA
jgi:hypothetical protein